MRAQRSGLVVVITSTAGITGLDFCSAYAAAKFGLEGWTESLTSELAPFGIRTMLVEPGFFRTELLTPESTSYAEPSIEDYIERTKQTVTAWSAMNGQQGGDPAKLAEALIQLIDTGEPPLRWAAGADAVQTLEQKARTLLHQADAPPGAIVLPRPQGRLNAWQSRPGPRAGRVYTRRTPIAAKRRTTVSYSSAEIPGSPPMVKSR